MSDLDALRGLAGRWTGNKRVLLPGEAPHESLSTVTVTPIIADRFVQIA
jgi:hypothetical protein